MHLYVERLLGHLYHCLVKGGAHLLVVELLLPTVDFLAQSLMIFRLRVAMGLFFINSTLLFFFGGKIADNAAYRRLGVPIHLRHLALT